MKPPMGVAPLSIVYNVADIDPLLIGPPVLDHWIEALCSSL